MTLNERILDFLDGSLPAEDEAELLHTLSVSPEKRGVLRGFMEQHALFARDSKTLSVPYDMEQRLWARLDQVMPAESQSVPPALVPIEAPSSGFFARALHSASAIASAVTLFAGIGIGYFAGTQNSTTTTRTHVIEIRSAAPAAMASNSNVGMNDVHSSEVPYARISHAPTRASAMSMPLLSLPTAPALPELVLNNAPAPAANGIADSHELAFAPVEARSVPPIAMNDIGDSGGIRPFFHHTHATRETEPSFLSRFEFRVEESFGRQFPNNAATNVSLPLITNTAVSTFFQVLPHSNVLWAGAGYGTANITRKNLFTQSGNPIVPSQQVLAADTAHAQTSYIAAMGELRLPAFATADLTFDAGYGLASLGQMMFGEIGFHYDISQEVGTQFGFRVVRFTYDLTSEKNAAIQSGAGGLAISNAVVAASPSFNTEINAGLFFHF